jgi:hypothetical protein
MGGGRRIVNFMLRPSYSQKKKHQNSLNRSLDGPRTAYEYFNECFIINIIIIIIIMLMKD